MIITQNHTYFRSEPVNPNKIGNSFNTYPKARRYAGKRGKVTKVTKYTVITETIVAA